jgi:hypothetical protein
MLNSAALLCPSCGRNVIDVTGDKAGSGPILSNGGPRGTTPYWRAAAAVAISPVEEVTPVAIWIALASAVTVLIGSIGPWGTISSFFGTLTVGGLDADGKVTIWFAIVAASLALFRGLGSAPIWTSVIAFISLGVTAIIGVIDWSNVANFIDSYEDGNTLSLAKVGWGLQLVTIASFVGCAAFVVHWIRRENAA